MQLKKNGTWRVGVNKKSLNKLENNISNISPPSKRNAPCDILQTSINKLL